LIGLTITPAFSQRHFQAPSISIRLPGSVPNFADGSGTMVISPSNSLIIVMQSLVYARLGALAIWRGDFAPNMRVTAPTADAVLQTAEFGVVRIGFAISILS
jgi:hypothetical protein